MKYLCLAYYDEKKFDTLSKSEVDAIVSRCGPYDDALRDSGHLLASGSLQPARSSIAVRPRNGKVAITDGPFTETEEQVGWGIEVRPMDMFEPPESEIRIPAAEWAVLQRLSSR